MRKDKFKIVNGHMEWTGATMREAQAKRDADLDRLFAKWGDFVPIVVRTNTQHMGLVFQQPDGYFTYRIFFEGTGWGSTHSGTLSKIEAERALRRHMAQAVYQVDGPNGLDVIAPDDEEGQINHKRWIRFQEEYRKAKAEGNDANTCHRLACERS